MSMVTEMAGDVKRRVTNLLWSRPTLRAIRVDAEEGVVVLRGSVSTFYERQLCISGARRVPGVHRIVDLINVATSKKKK